MPQDLLDYESRSQPLASVSRYAWRVLASFLIAIAADRRLAGCGHVGLCALRGHELARRLPQRRDDPVGHGAGGPAQDRCRQAVRRLLCALFRARRSCSPAASCWRPSCTASCIASTSTSEPSDAGCASVRVSAERHGEEQTTGDQRRVLSTRSDQEPRHRHLDQATEERQVHGVADPSPSVASGEALLRRAACAATRCAAHSLRRANRLATARPPPPARRTRRPARESRR